MACPIPSFLRTADSGEGRHLPQSGVEPSDRGADDHQAYLDGVDSLARRLVDTDERAYDLGLELMNHAGRYLEQQDSAGRLYLLWAELTDLVDGPYASEPTSGALASQLMRRAARDWLALDRRDADLDQYLDGWLLEELGQERGS